VILCGAEAEYFLGSGSIEIKHNLHAQNQILEALQALVNEKRFMRFNLQLLQSTTVLDTVNQYPSDNLFHCIIDQCDKVRYPSLSDAQLVLSVVDTKLITNSV
jgi:hypothetical protein